MAPTPPLEQLDPEAPDFPTALADAMKRFASTVEGERSFAAIFRFMEAHPEANFGTPGPIVHTLEELGGYEDALADSIRRAPTPHTLWMVNRILNAELPEPERYRWMAELRRIVANASIPSDVRAEALDFLQHQTRRD